GFRSHTVSLDVAGRSLLALAPGPLLIALACHVSHELDGVRLLRLLEIVLVARRATAAGALDWDEVLAMLADARAARFTDPAFALANDLAPGTIDERVITLGYRDSTWAARHTVARLVPAGGSLDDRGALRQLMWTRGVVATSHRLMRIVRPYDEASGWK